MKTCPVCRARTFDDAEVCYGCLYRFAGDCAYERMPVDDAGWEPDDGVMRGVPAPQAERGKIPETMKLRGGAFSSTALPDNGQAEAVDGRVQQAGRVVQAFASGDGVRRSEQVREGGAVQASAAREGKHASFRAGAATAPATPIASHTVQTSACPVSAAVRPESAECSRPVAQPESTALAASVTPPFNHAGWIVRFELPGCTAHTVVPHSLEARVEAGVAQPIEEASRSAEREGAAEFGWTSSQPLVISISPVKEGSLNARSSAFAPSAKPYASAASCERAASVALEGSGTC